MGAEGPRSVLTEPLPNARHESFAGIDVAVVHAGAARVKRLVYPPGFRWSQEVRPLIGTEVCHHCHVGFLAQGHLRGEYEDGCGFDFVAPAVIVIEPGHDAWVVGDDPAVLIQFDFEADSVERLGLQGAHHD